MKARKDAFKSIYETLDQYRSDHLLLLEYPDRLVFVADKLDALLSGGAVEYQERVSADKLGKRLSGRFLTMQKWVKSADILVIMDNNKPMLFLKYVST